MFRLFPYLQASAYYEPELPLKNKVNFDNDDTEDNDDKNDDTKANENESKLSSSKLQGKKDGANSESPGRKSTKVSINVQHLYA